MQDNSNRPEPNARSIRELLSLLSTAYVVGSTANGIDPFDFDPERLDTAPHFIHHSSSSLAVLGPTK